MRLPFDLVSLNSQMLSNVFREGMGGWGWPGEEEQEEVGIQGRDARLLMQRYDMGQSLNRISAMMLEIPPNLQHPSPNVQL